MPGTCTRTIFLKFCIHLSVKIAWEKLQTNNNMENLKEASGVI